MTRPTLAQGLGAAGTTLLGAFLLIYGPLLLPIGASPLVLRGVSVLLLLLLYRSVVPRVLGVPAHELGLAASPRTLARFAVGLGLGAATLLFAFCIAWGAGGFTVAPGLDGRGLRQVAFDLGLFAVGALFEELLFRVGLVGTLRTVLPASLAVGASAAVFGLLHATNPEATTLAVTNTMLAGLALGLLFLERRGAPGVPSLGLCTGFHFAWNATQSQLLGIPVSGYAGYSRLFDVEPVSLAWSGGSYGLEAGYGATLALGALCVIAAKRADLSTSWSAPSR